MALDGGDAHDPVVTEGYLTWAKVLKDRARKHLDRP